MYIIIPNGEKKLVYTCIYFYLLYNYYNCEEKTCVHASIVTVFCKLLVIVHSKWRCL